jgi:hypothetical protein
MEAIEPRILFSQVNILVTNVNNSGAGSLRTAIQQANALPAADEAVIQFKIPGSGVHVIEPLSGFDFITGEVDIQGTTDSKGNPLIELDGAKAGSFSDGLFLDRNTPGNTFSSTISGLIINSFGSSGIDVNNGTAVIYGCRIGTNAAGTAAMPNGQQGILLEGQGSDIGAPAAGPAFQMLISGNTGDGITITSSNNRIENCLIGTDVTGTKALPNGGWGIQDMASNNKLGEPGANAGLVVSGNVAGGIHVTGTNSSIQNSKVGTNSAGTAAIANKSEGVFLDATIDATVGGTSAGAGNVVSGNVFAGVSSVNSPGAQIIGNKIGTNAAGTAAIGNHGAGVYIDSYANVVKSNLISGNGFDGVVIEDDSVITQNSLVELNKIGTDVTGTKSIANKGDGILLEGTTNNRIMSNTIAFSAIQGEDGFGVDVLGNDTTGNTIEQNSIFSNGRLGINLGDNGGKVLPNDPGDMDTGANDLQNYPVLASAVPSGGKLVVKGTLNSHAKATFRIEFFSSPTADPSGYGEGQKFLGFVTVTTNSSGNATFSVTLASVPVGQVITATATNSSGSTSEFSKAIKVT